MTVRGELLDVRDLAVAFRTERGTVRALFGVSFSVEPGETLGLVGESGCGKTVSALSILRLLPSPPAIVEGGRIRFRGKEISMIFQEPMTSLNPVMTIGDQVAEVYTAHGTCGKAEAAARAREWLRRG